jgi:hypothetical protein
VECNAPMVEIEIVQQEVGLVAGKGFARMTCVVAALLLSCGMDVVSAGPAAAVNGTASCGQVKGTGVTGTVTFSGCTDKSNTGDSGTVPEIQFGGSASTITWAKGKGTTSLSITWSSSSKTRNCPSGTMYLADGTGRVVADAGLGSSIAVGGEVKIKLCMAAGFVFTLEPATRFKL